MNLYQVKLTENKVIFNNKSLFIHPSADFIRLLYSKNVYFYMV
jgi:hypothetical protein